MPLRLAFLQLRVIKRERMRNRDLDGDAEGCEEIKFD